nr:hypothetical protein [Streptomyces sp. NRRL B-24720]
MRSAFVGDALEVVVGGAGGFQAARLLVGDVDVEGGDAVVYLLDRAGADDGSRDDMVAAQPGEGDLGAGHAAGVGHGATSSMAARSLSA